MHLILDYSLEKDYNEPDPGPKGSSCPDRIIFHKEETPMKTGTRLTALFLALALLMTAAAPGLVTTAHAADVDLGKLSMTYINPLYEDTVTEADLKKPGRPVLYADNRDDMYFYGPEEAGNLIRDDLVNRDETIIVDIFVPYTGDAQGDFENACYETLAWAMVHTGRSFEGDYLQWQYAGWGAAVDYYDVTDDGYLVMTVVFTITYYTTAEQERQMDQAVEALIAELGVYNSDNYTKLKAIYDYICANVTYDYENLNDDDYKLKHTAYAALIDGTAVCQGYALLLYRLALEMNVDCRLIAGDGGGPHGWNIAEIDGQYYNLDSTWDAGKTVYDYFLVCPDNFTDHVRYEEYDTPEFHEYYPMGIADYFYCTHEEYTSYIGYAPTCTSSGLMHYACTVCGAGYSEVLPATGHSHDDGVITTAATCTQDGVMTYTCTACGDAYTEAIDALGHDYQAVVTAPTCTENGYTTHTCAVCGDTYTDSTTAALGHAYDAGVVTTAPTCTANGVMTYTCTACGDTTTEVIPATGHNHNNGTVTKEPTCSETGVMTYTCTTCGDTFTEAIATEPHNFADGRCTACGAMQMAVPTIESCYSKAQTSVKVTWTVSDGADGYELWRSTTPDKADSWSRVKTMTGAASTIYTNQGLEIGTTYYYKVRAYAVNADGSKTYTDFSNVDYMPAAVVFNNVYGSSTSVVRLRWNEVGGAHGYQIWRMNEDGSYSIVKTIGDRGSELTNNQGRTTAYSNAGLEAGKAYTYKMRAFRITDDGRKIFGTFSTEFTVTSMPDATTITGSSPKAGRVQISWDAVNGAAGYQVWMAESNGAYKIAKSVTDGSTSATIYGLTSGTTYSFQIRAYTSVDGKMTFGAYSNVLEITVQ